MKVIAVACLLAGALVTGDAAAADMLPLKQGLYVPVETPCKGASNVDIVNYWGKDSSIGTAQAKCKIKNISKKGKDYTITDTCVDIRSGDEIEGEPTHVTIASSTNFTMGGVAYRYCGTKVQF